MNDVEQEMEWAGVVMNHIKTVRFEDEKTSLKLPISSKNSHRNEQRPFKFIYSYVNILNVKGKLLASHIDKLWKSEGTRDLWDALKFVVLYGLMGETVLLTFAKPWYGLGWMNIIEVLGCGSLIYLAYDAYKYYYETKISILRRGK